ncbi:MAG TPA: DUF885 domain-containing protein [Reyranellaceae bacterium]|nr:DUF885 domain-containing protein [Reyranellaceae bacterium]
MSQLQFTRREAVAAFAATAALPLVSGCARTLAARPAASEAEATALLDTLAENLLRLFPESATTLGVDKEQRASLRSLLTDRSAAGQQRIRNTLAADLLRANAMDVSGLSHSTRTSFEVVRSAYSTALEGFALPYGDVAVGGWRNTPYVVIQNVGAYLDVPRFLDADHPVNNAADAEAYLSRLQSYPRQLDGELGRIRAARSIGLVPPAFLLDKALNQLRASAKSAREGGSLVESIERRTRNIPGDWARRARRIAAREVAPALDRQIAELTVQRRRATNDAGMWARPHGDAFYRWALKASTTTSMTPDEVHALGFEEVRRLHAEMDVILKGLGYTQGSVGARMTALGEDERFKYPDNDGGRAEILSDIQKRLSWIRAQMPRAFNTLVPGNVEVRRLPPEEEPGAPGAYGGAGSIDGTIPGKFWINLRTTELHSRYSLPTLAHHEAIPGHVWQGEYANKLPLIRTLLSFNAYSEGWGLYAEQLAAELGAYDGDPVGRLGYLQSLAFRACRLVVDTGLHHKRWTREQAIQYVEDNSADAPGGIVKAIERYIVYPGQATAYMVGRLKITELRERARQRLGDRFDIKGFHDAILLQGAVPLDIMERNVEAWIARQGG